MPSRLRSRVFRIGLGGLVGVAMVGACLLVVGAQSMPGMSRPAESSAGPAAHGTPPGWTFTWPKGDPVKGREVFVKLECYSCQEGKGERFPAPSEAGKVGPELSMMGPMHPPAYFLEAVVNPNAVVEQGKGYDAPDGSSKMPSYNDAITVQEVIDLVAFLTALRPPADVSDDHGGH